MHTCQEALQTRHILMYNSTSLYYVKTTALLSEIYEARGQIDLALAECDSFFQYWKNADPGLPLLVEMQSRLAQLKLQSSS